MSLAIQAALANINQDQDQRLDLNHQNTGVSLAREDLQSDLALKTDPVARIRSLAGEFQPIQFDSIRSGAETLARQGPDPSSLLSLGSELAEILMSNDDIGGESRRSLSRAQREATLLAGTDPNDALLSLSRYNFLAYHLNEAAERMVLPAAA